MSGGDGQRAGALVVRPLGPEDEAEARAAHAELAGEGFEFLLGFDPAEAWGRYLEHLERFRTGVGLPQGWVPATFLVGVADGVLAGRLDVRHRLTPALERVGGHIGYAVRPGHRRRGHATTLLRRALRLAASLGIDPALVTCDDDNVGSIRTIERCGGVLADVIEVPGTAGKRRYWIATA